ncbi:MAG: methionine--tRNA ligase [Candidatus Edwardsbacteria bacterium]|nr:methionine--tRNA ligase [Candidatus Edwardsbacteria bacterium]
MKRFYITTAIPYVNAKPHVGFALEIIQTDALARYQRLFGRDVRFLTGSDENALKNVQCAEKEGIPTATLVERNAKFFSDMKRYLSLSNDDFIRTSSEERHTKGVAKLWAACFNRGDIYKKRYQGMYCVGCEQFYTPDELADGRCPEHDTELEKVEEENYFFRLSNYQKQLEELIESDEYRIAPKTKKNEALSFIRSGLQDFSISRSKERAKGWGIPVPGDPAQVVYVWFDALSNYINALGFADEGPLYREFWTECPERVHVIGKGIIRFHAVYWPALLLSAKVPRPHKLLVHGYVTIGGQKISKSLGNIIDPEALAGRYGTDQLRYFLLREISTTGDGDYTNERLEQRINSDLANDYGNLASRIFKMVEAYCGGVVPEVKTMGSSDDELKARAVSLGPKVKDLVEQFSLNEALEETLNLVRATNRYIESNAPWKLYKEKNQARIDAVLYCAAEALRIASVLLYPAMPSKCLSLLTRMGQSDSDATWEAATSWGLLKAGLTMTAGEPLFPRIGLKTKHESEKQMVEKANKENTRPAQPVAIAPVADELIDIEYFKKVKLRTAEIVSAEKVPGADKLLRLQVKIGDETRQVLAGIAQWYQPESLVGQQIVVVVNLKPARIRGLESNGMLLAAQDEGGVVILTPQRRVATGSEVR